jgi:hypothetical protein
MEGVGAAIGWQGFCMAVEGDGLVRPCASGVHKVGKEADVVGGGLQRCVDEVDCVVWRRAIPYSGGRFGTRTPFVVVGGLMFVLRSLGKQLGCRELRYTHWISVKMGRMWITKGSCSCIGVVACSRLWWLAVHGID